MTWWHHAVVWLRRWLPGRRRRIENATAKREFERGLRARGFSRGEAKRVTSEYFGS